MSRWLAAVDHHNGKERAVPCAVAWPLIALGVGGQIATVDEEGTLIGGVPGGLTLLPGGDLYDDWDDAVTMAESRAEFMRNAAL